MKKIFTLMLLIQCIATYTMGQNNNISLYVYVPIQNENVPESSMAYLANVLCSAITEDGLAAQNDHLTQFILAPEVNILSKNIVPGTRQQIAYSINLNIKVIDNINGNIYGSENIVLKGVGTNEIKTFNTAFKGLNKNNKTLRKLASEAKIKIISFYESESEKIIQQAELASKQEKFDEAFYLLSMIPFQCSKYDLAVSAGLKIWEEYNKYSCSYNIERAKAIWNANQDIEAANRAGVYLSQIFQDSPCYKDAQELHNEIKNKVGEFWNFEIKVYDSELELKKAKIKAIQEVGIAYGKGQKPNVEIIKQHIK